jgi:uncharacterized membrane protein YkoI
MIGVMRIIFSKPASAPKRTFPSKRAFAVKQAALALSLVLLTVLPAAAHAGRDDRPRGLIEVQNLAPRSAADRRVSLAQAIESVQRSTGGKVLDAKDLGEQYRIKVLTRSGEIRIVYVDARTGAMR